MPEAIGKPDPLLFSTHGITVGKRRAGLSGLEADANLRAKFAEAESAGDAP
jgi:hypothetical protein